MKKGGGRENKQKKEKAYLVATTQVWFKEHTIKVEWLDRHAGVVAFALLLPFACPVEF